MATADQSTPLGRLHELEKCVVKSLECVGNIIEEFSKTSSRTEDIVKKNGMEFEHLTQFIITTLKEEIRNSVGSRKFSFENYNYGSRIAAEISCKKIDCMIGQLDDMEETIRQYHRK